MCREVGKVLNGLHLVGLDGCWYVLYVRLVRYLQTCQLCCCKLVNAGLSAAPTPPDPGRWIKTSGQRYTFFVFEIPYSIVPNLVFLFGLFLRCHM